VIAHCIRLVLLVCLLVVVRRWRVAHTERDVLLFELDIDTISTLFEIAGNEDVVRFILNSGAEVSIVNNNDATPLFYAAAFGHAGVVGQLLKRGASASHV
jgi:ankyrin repeat protein